MQPQAYEGYGKTDLSPRPDLRYGNQCCYWVTTFSEGVPSCKGAETLPRIARRYAGRDVPVSPYTHELIPSAPATVVATATITFKIIFHRFFFFSSIVFCF